MKGKIMTEEWRHIPGFEGAYQVSSLGRIKSLERTVLRSDGGRLPVRQRIVKPMRVKRGGYDAVQLHLSGKRFLRTVHSLMALAFFGPRPLGMDVCHRNDDRVNTIDLLRYDTRGGNVADAKRNGRIRSGEHHWNVRLTPELAVEIRRRRRNSTMREIAEDCGVSESTVHRVVHNKAWV